MVEMVSIIRGMWYYLKVSAARWYGVSIASPCSIGPASRFNLGYRDGHRGSIAIGPGCEFQHAAVLFAYGGSISLGKNVFVGPYAVIYGHAGVVIGEQTLISMHCRILSSEHSVLLMGVDIRSQPDRLAPTRIGRDVWLGSGVTVLGGVTIGDGCVVGAGSVVTKDLPAGSICYGTPAKVAGWRDGAGPDASTHPIVREAGTLS
jgi:acetyltransferase-like isoleucine patch superfamily enzyme